MVTREPANHFDEDSVRRQWDAASEAYADAQDRGVDYYRLNFFGPAMVEACGDVQGLDVLDVGCGAGYFSREMAQGWSQTGGWHRYLPQPTGAR